MTIFRLWTEFSHRRMTFDSPEFREKKRCGIGILTNNPLEKLWKCTIARKEKLWYDRHILVGLLYSTTIDPAC